MRVYIRVFVLWLLFPSCIFSQFSLPKVPAELEKYKYECDAVANSGYTQRNDFKYKLNDGLVTTEKHIDRIVKFNSEGMIKEFIYIDEEGRNKAIVIFEYYTNGLPKTESEFHPTGEFLKRTNIIYNTEGELLEKSSLDQYGNIIQKVLFSIDKETNTLIEKVYPFPDVVMEKNIWVYSSITNGRLIRYEKYDGETVLKYKRKLLYKGDKLVMEEYYNPAGGKAFYLEYTYNSESNISKIDKVLLDGIHLKNAIFQYNSFGLLIGKIEYGRYGKILSYYKYSYE